MLTLAKMGVMNIEVFDEDGVSEHNLPNQFYRNDDIGQFKVQALMDLVNEFTPILINLGDYTTMYSKQKLQPIVIVGTDSMSSRRLVWEQFLKQKQAKQYIEARMGAEVGQVYTIQTKSKANIKFYEEQLYSDDEVKPLPCTAKSIIYNVLMISSLICRAVKAVIHEEKFPRELTMNMHRIDALSFMVRK